MEEGWEITKVSKIFELCTWLDLKQCVNEINQENLVNCLIVLVSKIFKSPEEAIRSLWDFSNISFEWNFCNILKLVNFNLVSIQNFYDFLTKDSLIEFNFFLKQYIESFDESENAFKGIYLCETFLRVYNYIKQYNLFFDSNGAIEIIITKSKPKIDENNKNTVFYKDYEFNLKENEKIRNRIERNDNLFVIGRNKKSKIIDANFYSNQKQEEIICLIIKTPNELIFIDFDHETNTAFKINDPQVLRKNNVFRLGYFSHFSVIDVKCSRNPFLVLKFYNKESTILTLNSGRKYKLGKEGDIQLNISGVSRCHCMIYFNDIKNIWEIEDNRSQNGLFLLIKDKYQYENMQVSSPIRLKHSERIILGVDRQFCIVKAVD